ncbi:MAG: GumC family protein [Cyanobacteriota bacterium]
MTPPIVKRFLISFEQNKLLGFFTFAAVLGVSGVVAMQSPPPPPPTYKAVGILSFNNPGPVFTTTGEQLQQQGRQVSEEMLLADSVLKTVAQSIPMKPEQLVEQVRVRLPKEEEPNVITVEYVAGSADNANSTLTILMQQMVEHSRFINTSRLRDMIASIEQRLPEAKQEMTAAEQALDSYIREEGSALLAAQDGTLVGGITGTQQQQRQTQLQLEAINAQINSLVTKLGLTPEQAYTASALSADPIIGQLRAEIYQTEQQMEVLGQDLRAEHPTMIQLRQQLQANETLLQERAAEVIGQDGILVPLPSQIRKDSSLDPARQQIANQLVTLQTERESLLQQLQTLKQTELELRQQYEQMPNKQMEQARLQQQVQLKQSLYNKMLTALVDAQAAEAETTSSLAIAQPPVVRTIEPPAPMNPVIIVTAGGVVGVLAGVGVIFLLSTLDNRLYTVDEIRNLLTLREVVVLGELPMIVNLTPNQYPTPVIQDSHSPYLPFYERFRSNLRRLEPTAKVILITSVQSREGKSVSAYNLAIASAQAGKRTLLIEADLRSPSNAHWLNLELPDESMAIDPLEYYSFRNECIRLVPEIENLYILPSVGPQRQAAAILESSEFKRLFEDARGRFDTVIVDTPSLSSCNDAFLIEPLTNGMILVTRPGYTQESMLATTVDQFVEEEMPLLGAVINDVEKLVPLSPISVIEDLEAEAIETEELEDEIDEIEELEEEENTTEARL